MTIKSQGGIFRRNPTFNDVEVDGTLTVGGNAVPDASTLLVDGDIGSTVQGYDADTAKYDDTTANFTGTLQNGGSNVVVDTDIGSTVEAYDSTILKSADIGSTVQAYDADTAKLDVEQTWTAKQTFIGTDIKDASNVRIRFYDISNNFESGIEAVQTPGAMISSSVVGDLAIRSQSDILFATGGNTERMRILSTGGITFNGDTAAANALDDYEEGTWTPQFSAASGTLTTNASFSGGRYTKIGNTVTVWAKLRVGTRSSPSGAVNVTGLPYTSANVGATDPSQGIAIVNGQWDSSTSGVIFANTDSNATTVSLFRDDGSGRVDDAGTYMPAVGDYVYFSVTYRAA